MYEILVLLTIVFGIGVNCSDLVFQDELISKLGLGWPSSLQIAAGNEALMKLRVDLGNMNSCVVTTPSGLTFNVAAPSDINYQRWSDGCGVRIRQVREEMEGRWRLTASNNDGEITGWIELYIIDGVQRYEPPPIILRDGETEAKVNLTTLDNDYCVVAKPFSESTLIPGHCALTLDRTTRSVQGNWDVLLGIEGQVSEVRVTQHVTVEAERLSTGYVADASSSKLHLYCNILHTVKNITFCRFQRTTSAIGYNVVDGLSDGRYSYYGDGFALKQCGMTIESPSASDYGTWRCSVGIATLVSNHVVQENPMQALISVPSNQNSFNIQRNEKNNGNTRTVFVQRDTEFTLSCRADMSLSYCWFQHPNGSQFTPVKLSHDTQLFWYAGESLDLGDCSITFTSANISDAGPWICHMGPKDSIGLEVTDHVELRVTGPLAANKKEVPVTIGESATLYCHTSNGNRPLRYCRFLSPTFMGFNIDSSVTEENAILGRFYFTPDRNVEHGDCSLTIREVRDVDVGEWTCAAVVDNAPEESRDTMRVYVDSRSTPRFQAGIIGAAAGLTVLVLIAVGYVSYNRGWINRLRYLRRNNSTVDNTDAVSVPTDTFSLPLSSLGRGADQSSVSSGSSIEQQIGRH